MAEHGDAACHVLRRGKALAGVAQAPRARIAVTTPSLVAVGEAVRKVHERDAEALQDFGIEFNVSLVFGGQIKGEAPRLSGFVLMLENITRDFESDSEQDRLLMLIAASEKVEVRMWLTRRFVKLLWPLLVKMAESMPAIAQQPLPEARQGLGHRG